MAPALFNLIMADVHRSIDKQVNLWSISLGDDLTMIAGGSEQVRGAPATLPFRSQLLCLCRSQWWCFAIPTWSPATIVGVVY